MKGYIDSVFKPAGNKEKAEILGCMLGKLEGKWYGILDHFNINNTSCKLEYKMNCRECGLTADIISADAGMSGNPIKDARSMIEEMKRYVETTKDNLEGKGVFDVITAAQSSKAPEISANVSGYD